MPGVDIGQYFPPKRPDDPAFLDDPIIATVVAERVEGARAFFSTLIKRGEEVLVEVQSTWCSLDSDTRRPSRLARDVVRRFLPD